MGYICKGMDPVLALSHAFVDTQRAGPVVDGSGPLRGAGACVIRGRS